jgi:protein phosphatase methylesterase 1
MEGVEGGSGSGDGGDGNVKGDGSGSNNKSGTGPAAIGRKNGKGGSKPWRWRTDLGKTQPFWEGWFTGLSKKFLTGRGGKMLLLAGTDRLDTELTIGQMQGMLLAPRSLDLSLCERMKAN